MSKANIMGVNFDAVTLTQAADQAMEQIRAGRKGYVVTPNPEIVYQAMEDPDFQKLMVQGIANGIDDYFEAGN